jgi:mRNA deadenylase 3'-5' endonuclease subunit Ccr4
VDFIWFTPAQGRHVLRPLGVLLPPSPELHLRGHARCLPNASIPSDHISLVADFQLAVDAAAAADEDDGP